MKARDYLIQRKTGYIHFSVKHRLEVQIHSQEHPQAVPN